MIPIQRQINEEMYRNKARGFLYESKYMLKCMVKWRNDSYTEAINKEMYRKMHWLVIKIYVRIISKSNIRVIIFEQQQAQGLLLYV